VPALDAEPAPLPDAPPTDDRGAAVATNRALDMLAEQLARERERADRAETRADAADVRAQELAQKVEALRGADVPDVPGAMAAAPGSLAGGVREADVKRAGAGWKGTRSERRLTEVIIIPPPDELVQDVAELTIFRRSLRQAHQGLSSRAIRS
jgi:hypothetical protein